MINMREIEDYNGKIHEQFTQLRSKFISKLNQKEHDKAVAVLNEYKEKLVAFTNEFYGAMNKANNYNEY